MEVTPFAGDSETKSNGSSFAFFRKSLACAATRDISTSAPPAFSISLSLVFICLRIPTAGVKGV